MSKKSEIKTFYTKSGLERYFIEVSHEGLNQYKQFRSDDMGIVLQKAKAQMARWDEIWKKQSEKHKKTKTLENKKSHAEKRTKLAKIELARLEEILMWSLLHQNKASWDNLKDKSDYSAQKPQQPTPLPKVLELQFPPEPKPNHPDYQPQFTLFDYLFFKTELKTQEAAEKFKSDHANWSKNKLEKIDQLARMSENQKNKFNMLQEQYLVNVDSWEEKKCVFLQKQDQKNATIDQKKKGYLSGDISLLIVYCNMVLDNSEYPNCFPKKYELDYNPDNEIMIIDYQLPSPSAIPTLSEVRYIQARDEYQKKSISQAQLNKLYDGIVYQTALRTIHELYKADDINALKSIVFNGYVTASDPATGNKTTSCVLSIQAIKEDFEQINLRQIEPKACFKKLKGIGCSKLHSLTSIAPIIQIDKEDKRFVSSYNVTSTLDQNHNLAAMDWEDFEHLVREIFEKKFSENGGEVKVTQASRDGGVDAIAFAPDPITGGKTVIQAKRYTNTVGVEAVRALHSTVIHEGANKGILVTTSDYGPDAYKYIQGKPLTLINGNNLLYLLEEHGHTYKIDLPEAKKIIAERENEKQ